MSKWPKVLPALTPEQKLRSDQFMKLWHEVLPNRYGIVERFNHSFPVKFSKPGFKTTLEIGAGLGEHICHEKLTPEQEENYYANEFRENMVENIREKFPRIKTIVKDCQTKFDFPNDFFDRFIAVHVFEHLPNLPETIREAHRLLNKDKGQLLIVIPTEGSPAYTLARKISAERVWKKYFDVPYKEFIGREHINLPHEILEELNIYFKIDNQSYFPLKIPFVFCNLCIGLALKPR